MKMKWHIKWSGLTTRQVWIGWIALYFIAALSIYAPALGSQYMVAGVHNVTHDYLMHFYGWQSILKNGDLPIWNAFVNFGLPMLGARDLCLFYPTQWLYLILPHNTAFTMQYVLALTVGAVCMMIWMRTLKFRPGICGWSGLAFMFSGHFLTLTYGGQLQQMIAIAWAPGAFAASRILCMRALARDKHCMRPALLFALCLTMQLLASDSRIFYGTFVICLLQMLIPALPLFVKAWKSPEPGVMALMRTAQVRSLICLVKWFAFACVMCWLLSAVQMFHTREISAVTDYRGRSVPYELAARNSYPPLEVLEYAISGLWGDSVVEPTTNRPAGRVYNGSWGVRETSDFLGFPILFLCLIALVAGQGRYRHFMLFLLIMSLLVAFGSYTPVHRVAHFMMPGFGSFTQPAIWLFVANIALIVLSCYGLDVVIKCVAQNSMSGLSDCKGPRSFFILRIIITLISAAGAVAIVIGIYRNWGVNLGIATPEEAASYRKNALFVSGGLQALLSGALLSLALSHHVYQWKMPAWLRVCCRYSGVAFAVLALLIPLCVNKYYVRFGYLERFMEIANYQRQFVDFGKTSDLVVRKIDDKRDALAQMLHGVGMQEGELASMSAEYRHLLEGAGFSSERFGQLMNVMYAHTTNSVPPRGTWQPLYQMPRDSLWRWSGPSRSYSHNFCNVVLTTNERGTDEVSIHGRKDDFAVDSKLAEKYGIASGIQQVEAALTHWRSGYATLEVATRGKSPVVLPVAEPYYPGWKASLADGNELKIIPVNGALVGVILPPNVPQQALMLRYAPRSLSFGLFLTLLTLFACIFSRTAHIAALIRHYAAVRVKKS